MDGLKLVDCGSAMRCIACRRKTSRCPPEDQHLPAISDRGRSRACAPACDLALGRARTISVVNRLKLRGSAAPFVHGAVHSPLAPVKVLYDSYHCSRYNTNTGVLTPTCFAGVCAGQSGSVLARSLHRKRGFAGRRQSGHPCQKQCVTCRLRPLRWSAGEGLRCHRGDRRPDALAQLTANASGPRIRSKTGCRTHHEFYMGATGVIWALDYLPAGRATRASFDFAAGLPRPDREKPGGICQARLFGAWLAAVRRPRNGLP